jgi:NAD(P)-dependent dehydrogenase (short-subunit alcohol dehydrogenase family)
MYTFETESGITLFRNGEEFMTSQVIVIIGAGGMGEAIARRQGPGKTLVLADVDPDLLHQKVTFLGEDGFDVVGMAVDVSSHESVRALADRAESLGHVTHIVHTAGLSPVQASVDAILRVDLLGVSLMLHEFAGVVAQGGSGIVIASMAGHMGGAQLSSEQEFALATTPVDTLLDLPFLQPDKIEDRGAAYSVAKRANQLRVRAACRSWGDRGARVNSISPGVISTPMGQKELSGPTGDLMHSLIAASASGRVGTPSDIAAAAAFLLSGEASFITGTDLLVDGGVVATLTTGGMQTPSSG